MNALHHCDIVTNVDRHLMISNNDYAMLLSRFWKYRRMIHYLGQTRKNYFIGLTWLVTQIILWISCCSMY